MDFLWILVTGVDRTGGIQSSFPAFGEHQNTGLFDNLRYILSMLWISEGKCCTSEDITASPEKSDADRCGPQEA